MNIDQLLIQSLQLLGLGMGSVFIILCLLILVITLVSKLVPEVESTAAAEPSASGIDTQHVAAIQAAIHHYRRARRAKS